LVDVERQVIQEFIGNASWDHRPLVTVLVGYVAHQLGEPDGNDAKTATCPPRFAIKPGMSSVWTYSTSGGIRCRTAGSPAMMSSVATHGCAMSYESAVSATCWGCLAPLRLATYRPCCRSTPGVDAVPRPRGNR
jgi:hypothetical protein